MDLKDIVAPLPAESHVRRLIEFCIDDLKMKPYELASAFDRAHRITDGIGMLEHEARLARGEYTQAAFERIDKLCADISNIARPLLER